MREVITNEAKICSMNLGHTHDNLPREYLKQVKNYVTCTKPCLKNYTRRMTTDYLK